MPPNEGPEFEQNLSPDWSPTSTPFAAQTPPPEFNNSDSEQEQISPTPFFVDFTPTIHLYGRINTPLEPSLKEILIKVTETEDLSEVTKVQLKVIAREVSLQHLGIYTPNLKELILDGSVVSSLRDLGCGLKNLKILRVARCGLTSFDGLFGLQSLEELHASDNQLENLYQCTSLPDLKVLDVRRNFLQSVAAVNFLTLCEKLENLMLEGNEAIFQIDDYRQEVKRILPNLLVLDNQYFEEAASLEYKSSNDEEDSESSEILDADFKDDFLKETPSTSTGLLPPIDQGRGRRPVTALPPINAPRTPRTYRPLSSTSHQGNSTRGDSIRLPNINSGQISSSSSLTSGEPICGNLVASLRSRMRRNDAWREDHQSSEN